VLLPPQSFNILFILSLKCMKLKNMHLIFLMFLQCNTSKKFISIPRGYCSKSLKEDRCPSSKMFSPNLNWNTYIYHLKVTIDKSS